MKKSFLNLTCALTIGACFTVVSVDAQNNTRQSNTPAKGNSAYGKSQGTSAGNSTDQMFMQKAMEADKAEIELSRMALQKASSDKVKEFAQMMIDEHTRNSTQLTATVSGMATGNAPERMGTGNMGNDNTGTSGSTTTGSTTTGSTSGTGTSGTSSTSGTSGSGNTGNDNMGTSSSGTGNTSGTMGSSGSGSTGSNNQSSTSGTSGSGNLGNAGSTGTTSGVNTGTSGTSSSGTTGTTSTGTSGTSGNTGATSGSSSTGSTGMGSTSGSGMGNTSGMGTSDMMAGVELSPEHRALSDRLAKLTGAEFDREYIQAQIKDHDKTIALYENQAKNGKDAQMKEFARTMLPNIRKHRQMAMDLSTNMRSGSKSGSMNH